MCIYIYIYTHDGLRPMLAPMIRPQKTMTVMTLGTMPRAGLVCTPGPRYKISRYNIFAKVWVAQKHLLIGNYRSGIRLSKGWVQQKLES